MIFTADAVYMGDRLRPAAVPAAIVNNLEQFYASVEKAARPSPPRRTRPWCSATTPDQIKASLRASRPTELPLMTAPTGVDPDRGDHLHLGAPPLKFGAGAVDEIGFEMAQYGAKRVLILTAPRSTCRIPARIADSLTKHGNQLGDSSTGCTSSPPTTAWKGGGLRPQQGPWDGFVAVGGGSSSTPPRRSTC